MALFEKAGIPERHRFMFRTASTAMLLGACLCLPAAAAGTVDLTPFSWAALGDPPSIGFARAHPELGSIMADPNALPLHYDRRTIVLHWLTAALVVSLWILGQTVDWFAKGDPRVFARSTHIALGVTLALVLVARISWRLGRRAVHLPPAGLGWLDKMATFAHWLLYGLLIATVTLGVANAWIRGDTIFNLFKIPAFDATNPGLKKDVEEWHALAANTLLFVAFFHAAAALVHHFVLKDGVLRRMLPVR